MASKKEVTEVDLKEPTEVEEEKLDIEDIKDPLDELEEPEEGVAEEEEIEEPQIEVEKKVVKEKSKKDKRSFFDRKKEPKVKKDVEKETEPEELTPESVMPKKKGKWGTVATILVTILVTAALVLGGVYAYTKYFKEEEAPNTAVQDQQKADDEVVPTETEKKVYVNSTAGLNLRKEPSTVAEILAIIPNGTELVVLDENDGWYKVQYESKEGWVSKEFTTETAPATTTPASKPITYTNAEFDFKLTLPAEWQGYKVIQKQVDWGTFTVTTYYFALPTKDSNWSEGGVTKGYASLFAITPFTKAQWAQVDENDKSKMDVLEETFTHTFTGAPGQAIPTDLSARYKEAVSILKTFAIE